MSEPISEGWITTDQAETLTGYASAYLRRLANQGRVEARKVGRDWLINQESLLAYKREMDTLGPQRHNPWREDLTQQGRGRNQPTNEPTSGGDQ
jgi:excisionase family DNA binding protein